MKIGRVVDRELVEDLVLGGAGEALGDLALRRVGEAAAQDADAEALGIEVGGLDHQGVALPPADRVAHPGPHVGRRVACGRLSRMMRTSWFISHLDGHVSRVCTIW